MSTAFLLTASQSVALSSPRLRTASFCPVCKVCCCYLLAFKNASKSRKQEYYLALSACMCKYINKNVFVYKYIHTNIHLCIHTHAYTHICMYIHIYDFFFFRFLSSLNCLRCPVDQRGNFKMSFITSRAGNYVSF